MKPVKLKKRLTKKEAEVLKLVGEGNSYGRVARELGISIHTVRTHARAIAAKVQGAPRVTPQRILIKLHHWRLAKPKAGD